MVGRGQESQVPLDGGRLRRGHALYRGEVGTCPATEVAVVRGYDLEPVGLDPSVLDQVGPTHAHPRDLLDRSARETDGRARYKSLDEVLGHAEAQVAVELQRLVE